MAATRMTDLCLPLACKRWANCLTTGLKRMAVMAGKYKAERMAALPMRDILERRRTEEPELK